MNIKDNLSNLITANGYDINNDEVKSALLSLAGSNIIKLPLDKKHIAIRTLSLNEYNKYITNGTLDGSITKHNINVWHFPNNKALEGAVFSHYGDKSNAPAQFSNLINGRLKVEVGETFNAKALSFYNQNNYNVRFANAGGYYNVQQSDTFLAEFLQNNKSSNCYFSSTVKITVVMSTNFYGSNESAFVAKYKDIENLLCPKTSTRFDVSNLTSFGYGYVRFYTYLDMSFRPVFNFVDNNKSKNIYY